MCRAGRECIRVVVAGLCLWGAVGCLGSGHRDLEAAASTGDKAESVRGDNGTVLELAAEKATVCSKEPVVLMVDWPYRPEMRDCEAFLFHSFRMEAVLPSGAKLVTDGLWRSDGELYDGWLKRPGGSFTLVSRQWIDFDRTGSYRLRLHCCEENRIDRHQESPQVISGRWKIASNWVDIEVAECSSSQLTSIANELLNRAKQGYHDIRNLNDDTLAQAHGRALSFFAEPEAVPYLVSMFSAVRGYAGRRMAMEGLTRIGTIEVLHALVGLQLENEAELDALRRMLSVLSHGSPGGKPSLLSGQKLPSASVRAAARRALSKQTKGLSE